MSELVNSTYISLDGVIENPHRWPATGGFGAEENRIQTDLVLACSALIMGRRTQDGMAPVWPTMAGDPAGQPGSRGNAWTTVPSPPCAECAS